MRSSEQTLKDLLAGNERFVSRKSIHPNQSVERRTEVVKGQRPSAVILGCSDSRIPPEIIFDQGIGDLFVIRVAGNIIDDAIMGSMEYAVEHLHVQLIVVLGHQKCGAVEATVKGGHAPGHIGTLAQAIQPAVEKARSQSGNLVENAIRIHVERMVQELKSAKPILAEAIHKGELQIVGARYDLESGRVEILG